MKKKFLFLSALVAATTAFIGCSSDENLAEVPEVIEEPSEEVIPQGTPFSVKAFGTDDTRAIRYGEGGKEMNDGSGWISELKIWGSQKEINNNWLQSMVFKRTNADSKEWTPARKNDGSTAASTGWPTTNTDKVTTFYAITDGNIANASGNKVNGVTENFLDGKIVYNPETAEIDARADGFESDLDNYIAGGWVQASSPADTEIDNFDAVDNSKIGDLMVATKVSVETADGSIPMSFDHALCGLYVCAKFCPVNQNWVTATGYANKFTIMGVRLHGLYTGGTYTFGSGWGSYTGQSGLYYYGLGRYDGGNCVTLEAEATTADPTVKTVVPSGTWLLVPQNVTGWDCSYNSGALPADGSGAYLEILYTNGDQSPDDSYAAIAVYPLPTMTFVAGHNYRLVIDVEKIRTTLADVKKDDGDSGSDGKCDYIFTPVKGGGQG